MPTRRTGRRLGIALAAVLFTAVSGCGRYDVTTYDQLHQLTRPTPPTLAITAPQLLMQHEPYQVFQYTLDVIDVLQVDHRLPVIAPWEYDPGGDLVRADSHQAALLALAERCTVSILDIVLLDFRIEESRTERSVAVPITMGGGIEHQYRHDITITLAARGLPYGQELARVVVSFVDDPLAPAATAANPRPHLRDGIRRAADELARLVDDVDLDGPPGAVPEVEIDFNPRQMFEYEAGTGESLDDRFASMDELNRMAYRLVYYQYFDPDISGAELRLFDRSPPGIVVQSVGNTESGLGLEVDDYITTVDGQPIAGPQSLLRPFLLTPVGGHVDVTLFRDGNTRRLSLPVLDDR